MTVNIENRMKDEDLHDEYMKTVEKSFSPIDDTSGDSAYGVWSQELRAWMDLNTLKGLYTNDDWVYILIDRIASKIAAQEMRVMKMTMKNGQAVYEPDEGHPINAVIYEPNENQTYYQWMYSLVADHCLAGNALVYYPKSYPQLIHIPVEMVQMDFDTNGKLSAYRIIQYNTNYEMPVPREVMSIAPEDIAHIRRPNPSSSLWGLSPFIPARKSVLFNRYSIEYLNGFYLKGAQPGLILDLSEAANEKQALRMLRSMEMAHTGRRNQRRNMVLPAGVKATTVNQSLADQQLKDYISQNRETLINTLQVPKHELSIAESGSLGSQEYKTALRNFWSGPLKSIMKSIEASLSKLFKAELGTDRHLEFDLTDVEFLQEDLNQKADLAIKMLQTHTLNEVRAQIFDDDPLEGGDVTPTKTPATTMFSTPVPEAKAVVTPEPEVAPEPVDEKRKLLDSNLKAFETLKSNNPTWWEKRQAVKQKDETQRYSAIHEATLNLFIDQTVAAVKIVKNNLKRQGFKAYGQKADYNKAQLKRDLEARLAEFVDSYRNATLHVLLATMEIGYQAQLILPFALPNRAQIEGIRERRQQARKDMIEGKNYEAFKQINQTSTDKIMSIIEEGITNGRTLDEIAANIVEDASNPVNTNSRALMIARTEVLSAASVGQAAAMQDAAEVIPDLKKMWINAGDDRVRGNPNGVYKGGSADHWTLGGELVNHDAKFSNGLYFPQQPGGPAGEVINCRCDFTFFSSKDALDLGIRQFQNELNDLQGSDN